MLNIKSSLTPEVFNSSEKYTGIPHERQRKFEYWYTKKFERQVDTREYYYTCAFYSALFIYTITRQKHNVIHLINNSRRMTSVGERVFVSIQN